MTEILITAGIGLVTNIVTGWSTWVFARKKYNSEVDHNIIENMKESLEFYESLRVKLATSICYDLSCKIRQKESLNTSGNEEDNIE